MDGFLLIDKPAGLTSHDVVDAVRKIAKTRRVGHAGTLDPFATGLLILGINKATKKLGNLVGLDKEYVATAHLGATSTTDDPEGQISNVEYRMSNNDKKCAMRNAQPVLSAIEGCEIPPSKDDLERVLNQFRGGYVQTAPAYSAKKVGGKKMYELARKGKMEGVELPTKDVTIHELEFLSYDWPELKFRVRCSSGTYVRALARDIGEALNVGAYLTELRRTKIGSYRIEDAISLSELNPDNIEKHVLAL